MQSENVYHVFADIEPVNREWNIVEIKNKPLECEQRKKWLSAIEVYSGKRSASEKHHLIGVQINLH